jgi:hypothetical protein
MSNQTEVATKVEELSTTLNVDVEDITISIEDGGLRETVISGADVAEYLTEGEDESEDTSEAGEEDEDISEADEDTTEGGEVHLEEMEYNDLLALISEADVDYPEDSSKAGLLEAAEDIEDVSTVIEDDEDISEADEDVTEGDDDEDTIEDGENEEDSISDAELVEAGVKESNIEDVRKYRSKNGVCSEENCPYGANNGEEFCASHQGSSSKSKTSTDSPKGNRELSDLSEAEQNLVSSLIGDEGKSLEEAISMV